TFDYTANPLLVEVTDGANLFTTLTDSLGYYARAINVEGTFDVRIVPESLPLCFEATPISESVTFVGFGNQAQVDFCITSTETVNDLKITLLTLNDARPGFDADYQIVYENNGLTVLQSVLLLHRDISLMLL
ncbi:MAG: hypothetical protein L3J54_14180, partial [Draconibacterium sp.]|nr:hypothetical protein [Draconibacterium sp.]